MFDDDLLGTVLGTLAFGAMYWLGSNAGEKRVKEEIKESLRDLEIERLKEELRKARSVVQEVYLEDLSS